MPAFPFPKAPEDRDLLVAFSDLTDFARASAEMTSARVFRMMDLYFELVGGLVEEAGGTVVKFIGDAFLAVFPANRADAGVRALERLREEGDRWFEERNLPCRHRIRAHFGPVTCGPAGTKSRKPFDVFGQTVNVAARRPMNGLEITDAAHQRLSAATKKLFRKQAPAALYVPRGASGKGR
jgi:adenylate cyclase